MCLRSWASPDIVVQRGKKMLSSILGWWGSEQALCHLCWLPYLVKEGGFILNHVPTQSLSQAGLWTVNQASEKCDLVYQWHQSMVWRLSSIGIPLNYQTISNLSNAKAGTICCLCKFRFPISLQISCPQSICHYFSNYFHLEIVLWPPLKTPTVHWWPFLFSHEADKECTHS